ncbi:MAG: flavoprotein, partial [Nanoarchaeota archaeon]|nr:flavoprotein [Nanoarchaeota archaeon]
MDDILKNKHIIIGITGSIAAYKALEIVKKLRESNAIVNVIMTKSATMLVDAKDFEKASRNPVQTELFLPNVDYKDYLKKNKPINHIS